MTSTEIFVRTATRLSEFFSWVMRQLFNESQVTGLDDATRTFLQVRDSTRQQAMIYVKKVLPDTEQVIRQLSEYLDCYMDLDFDDWAGSLSDTLNDLVQVKKKCQFLRTMYMEIIETLKKNEDKAIVGIAWLQTLREDYERQTRELEEKAEESKNNRNRSLLIGAILAPVTFGVSALIAGGVANSYSNDSKRQSAEAVAKKKMLTLQPGQLG